MQQVLFIPCPLHPQSQYDAFININPACLADRRISCQYCFYENFNSQSDLIRSDRFIEAGLNKILANIQVQYQYYDQAYKQMQQMIKEYIDKSNKQIGVTQKTRYKNFKDRSRYSILFKMKCQRSMNCSIMDLQSHYSSKHRKAIKQHLQYGFNFVKSQIRRLRKHITKSSGLLSQNIKPFAIRKIKCTHFKYLSEFYEQEILNPYLKKSQQVPQICYFTQIERKYLLTQLCTIQCQNLIQTKLGYRIPLGVFKKIYAADFKSRVVQAMIQIKNKGQAENHVKAQMFAAIWRNIANQKNTLFLMKMKHGQIIGAYTPIPWNLKGWSYEKDPNLGSFIFSVTREKLYPLKIAYSNWAIYASERYLPCFGENDLVIQKNLKITSILNEYYDASKYGQICRQKHLLGMKIDQIVEIEIHQYQNDQ